MVESGTNSSRPSDTVDLYALLDLEPLEPRREQIEDALRRLVKVANQLKDREPDKAKRAARIVALGKEYLLNEEKKKNYDQLWQNQYGADWDWETLDAALPDGDPVAAFNLSEFLENNVALPESRTESDFEKLAALMDGKQPSEAAISSAVASSQPDQVATPQGPAVAAPQGNGSRGQVQPGRLVVAPPQNMGVSQAPSTTTKSLAKKLRKKRERSLLVGAAGVLGSLAVVLGIIFFVIRPPAKPAGDPQALVPEPAPQTKPTAKPEGGKKRVGSGLPQVSGLAPGADISPNGNGGQEAMMPNPANDVSPPTQPPVNNDTNEMKPTEMKPSELKPNEMTGDTAETNDPNGDTKDPPKQLSSDDKVNWRVAMEGIRVLLGEQEYAQAKDQLDDQRELAITSEQQSQLIRLTVAADLAEQCHSGLVEAIASLSAGEAFTVGTSTQVSFVEGSATHVVLRISGTNRRFLLTELPIGIIFGLVDLKLDLVHPSSRAKKAAFTLMHPTSNEQAIGRARRMMSEATSEGFADAGLLAVFDDDYELP